MAGASIWHWVVVGVVVMLLFGRGKISELIGDAAKGIEALRKGTSDERRPRRERTVEGFDRFERLVMLCVSAAIAGAVAALLLT